MLKKYIYILLILGLPILSCQTSDDSILKEEPQTSQNTFNRNDPLVDVLQSVAQSKGHEDDVIDNFSHAKVVLPVELSVNNIILYLETEADIIAVKEILDASLLDVNIILFTYPIKIQFNNYSQEMVTSQAEFNAIKAAFANTAIDKGISCVALKYPITIMHFNEVSGISGNKSISTDASMYAYMLGLLASDWLEFKFPITVTKTENSTKFAVSNNTELKSTITSCI
jgi:hypothetical protein